MVRRAIARPPASTKYTSPPFATDLTTPALGEAVPSNCNFQTTKAIAGFDESQRLGQPSTITAAPGDPILK
jgi:hypothetical protein